MQIQEAFERYRPIANERLFDIPGVRRLPHDFIEEMRLIAKVLPFKVNQYVVDELIDWTSVPDDPIFQLTFPQPGMLSRSQLTMLRNAMAGDVDTPLDRVVKKIRSEMNPNPGGQKTMNVPMLGNAYIPGLQHKYRETVLYFPSHGQTCHAYCSFCFRWPQFIGDDALKFSSNDESRFHQYLESQRKVTDVLITGGDPMVMKARHFEKILVPLLDKRFEHVSNIRIGTKALTYWPYRFTHDSDSDELMRLFDRLSKAGKHVTMMAHFNHWRELEPKAAENAITRLRDNGVTIRSQAPLLRYINDRPETWTRLWKRQIALGIIPYYMFIERDTGASNYFQLPLERCWNIYRQAVGSMSGLSKTVRGPCMSATPGKVELLGITELYEEKVFMLRFLQSRDPDLGYQPFFAKFDPTATWFDELVPAFGRSDFGLRSMAAFKVA